MTAGEALLRYTSVLKRAGIEEAAGEIRVLLCSVLEVDSARLFAEPDRVLSPSESVHMEQLVGERCAGVPSAYLTSNKEFFGLNFYVDQRVLIPRPETEILVAEAIRFCETWKARHEGGIRIADVGTGSGAVAVSIAANVADCVVYATDVSPDALQVAGINVDRYKLAGHATLIRGDLLQSLPDKVDVVVANLPYIPDEVVPLLAEEIAGHEPGQALKGGVDGLELISRLAEQAREKIEPDGAMLLEIGTGQESAVTAMLGRIFPGARVSVFPDLAGVDRVIKIEI